MCGVYRGTICTVEVAWDVDKSAYYSSRVDPIWREIECMSTAAAAVYVSGLRLSSWTAAGWR